MLANTIKKNIQLINKFVKRRLANNYIIHRFITKCKIIRIITSVRLFCYETLMAFLSSISDGRFRGQTAVLYRFMTL